MMKRMFSLVLAVCLVLALVPVSIATAQNLTTASPWAQAHITAAIGRGFIPADIQNNYTNTITRAEFCRMAVKWVEYALGKDIDAILTEKGLSRKLNAFTDTNDPDILAAYALGITSGRGGGLFDPNGQFSREQAATMIMNTCGAIGAYTKYPLRAWFVDLETASSWAMNGIHFARANGIMQGMGNDIFNPKGVYTREQSIVTFNNIKPDELPVNEWVDTDEYALYDEYLKGKVAEYRSIIENDPYNIYYLDYIDLDYIGVLGKRVFDFDGDGVPELYYSIAAGWDTHDGDYYLTGGFCTIIDGKVVELLPLHSSGNFGLGISERYSDELSKHVIDYRYGAYGGYEKWRNTFYSMTDGKLTMLGEIGVIYDWGAAYTVNGIEVNEDTYNSAREDFDEKYLIVDSYIFPSLRWYIPLWLW